MRLAKMDTHLRMYIYECRYEDERRLGHEAEENGHKCTDADIRKGIHKGTQKTYECEHI